jgi:Spy/CpxP family protein refolding chaperone
MTEKKTTAKAGRPSRTLKEEIAATEQRLQQLRTKQREEERRELEKNQRAIMALVKSAGLDEVSSDKWQANLPKIVELLTGEKKAKIQAAPGDSETQTEQSNAPAESGAALASA